MIPRYVILPGYVSIPKHRIPAEHILIPRYVIHPQGMQCPRDLISIKHALRPSPHRAYNILKQTDCSTDQCNHNREEHKLRYTDMLFTNQIVIDKQDTDRQDSRHNTVNLFLYA